MVNDRDLKQERRRSFFLFGSVNLGKSDSTAKPSGDKQRRTSVSKHVTPKGPLDKRPLNNKNPFVDDTKVESAKVPKEEKPTPVATQSASTTTVSPRRASTNPFLNDAASQPIPGAKPRMRRPPPPIDMNSIRVFTQTARHDIDSGKNSSQPSSTEETLKSASHSPLKTPVPGKTSINEHRRQRSEAEKLVDDLDEYIKQHGESESANPQADEAKAWQEMEMGRSSSEHSSNMPSACVEPLDIAKYDTDNSNRDRSQERSDVESGPEADRFSFTDSLNDKSVNSIQQVAMSEITGAAPIMMNLHYGSPNDSLSDHRKSTEPLLNASSDEGSSSSSSSDDEFQEAEQIPVSDPPFDDDSSRSGNVTPKRVFRVVNEDRPQFYLQTEDSTTVSTTDSATTEEEEEQEYENGRFNSKNPDLLPLNQSSDLDKPLTPVSPVLSYTTSQHEEPNGDDLLQPNDGNFKTGNSTSSKELDNIDLLLEAGALTVKSHEEDDSRIDNTVDKALVRSNPSLRSGNSAYTTSSGSSKPDKTVRLVSSYVEELRLKYYKSSNFLAAPPNLPISLKQKNNLIQPKNIKVRIRTSSKQIGIKHGGAKQKLLSLETTNEDSSDSFSGTKLDSSKNRINVDHTKEFHDLLAKEGLMKSSNEGNEPQFPKPDDEYYLEDIPGDDAYDSDDAMAPLRKNNGAIARNNTAVSYFTKNQRRLRSGTLDNGYTYLQDLPTNINIKDYEDKDSLDVKDTNDSIISNDSDSIAPEIAYGPSQGLHVANPDTDSD